MARFGFTPSLAAFLFALMMGGCSLIVDFERGPTDSGMDGGVDAGLDGTVDAEENAAGGASSDAD